MGLRSNWKFSFAVSQVLRAVDDRIDHHRGRLNFWVDARDSTEEELRERGMEIRSHEVTGGHRLEASFDPGLERRFNEACSKIEEHREREDEFLRWRRVFELQDPNLKLELDFGDIQFFGL